MITEKTIIKSNPTLVAKDIDGKILLLDEKRAEIRQLNGVASDIWRKSKDWIAIDNLVDIIYLQYNESRETILKDVVDFVRGYLKDNILIKKRGG